MSLLATLPAGGWGGMGDGESVFCLDMADCSLVTNGDVDYALMFMFYKRISNEDLMFTTGYPG
jgi:hypothetical protein